MRADNKILSIIFMLLFSVFIISLYTDYDNFYYNNFTFWIPIIGMILIQLYQIFNLDENFDKIVLFELVMLYLGLHLIYIVGYKGLNGPDSYTDYNFLKSILVSGHFVLGGEISSWPVLHIFTASFLYITNLDPLKIAKFLPSIISSLIVLPLYILINSIYGNKKVSLLGILIFGTITQFIEFEGGFVREIMGLFFIILLFYIIYNYKIRFNQKKSFIIIFLLLLPLMVLGHHFSSLIFVFLLIIFEIMTLFIPAISKKKNFYKLKGKFNIDSILLICLVTLIAYWIYSAITIWVDISGFINNLLGVNEITDYIQQAGLEGPIISFRGNIIYYGFFIFNLILGSILILKLLIDNNREKIEDSTFTLLLIFCGFYGLMGTFFISTTIFPQRLLTFGWIFGVIPLAGFLLTLERMNKENLYLFRMPLRWLIKPKIGKFKLINVLFVSLIFSFMMFNIYGINPDYISKNYNNLGVAGDKEYVIASTIKFDPSYVNSEVYYGYSGVTGTIFDEQGISTLNSRDVSKITDLNTNFSNTNQIAIINENTLTENINYQKIKSIQKYNNIMLILSLKNNSNINKIADIGDNIYILKGTG